MVEFELLRYFEEDLGLQNGKKRLEYMVKIYPGLMKKISICEVAICALYVFTGDFWGIAILLWMMDATIYCALTICKAKMPASFFGCSIILLVLFFTANRLYYYCISKQKRLMKKAGEIAKQIEV